MTYNLEQMEYITLVHQPLQLTLSNFARSAVFSMAAKALSSAVFLSLVILVRFTLFA